MTLVVEPTAILPQCLGSVWTVADPDELAEVCAQILIGRALHAAMILDGVHPAGTPPIVSAALKEKLRLELHPQTDPKIWHRDGLLFEIISWVAARLTATVDDAISDPHLKATNQGTDCVKVTIDPGTRTLTRATVYEYKCTTNWRQLFSQDVLAAFREYVSGERDNQLAQAAITLLIGLGFTPQERNVAYDELIRTRPLAFQASLTVAPSGFTAEQRLALFSGYDTIAGDVTTRGGDTMPLDDVRAWFEDFSGRVWARIEAFDVRR
ncbi:hypothetical protein [Croceicoccus gelatinilyticus]|uniref:hypothetical protein n=1 Tax=Croceicoccus gelatinilyticus TaxID=2835536 RepID=UPI001BCEDF99|nr:hypothetical protein [Croceicoccus gelatinilyticus]MBS7671496.1 hypothetical protein [Croceicoccus gelatinilyticus]